MPHLLGRYLGRIEFARALAAQGDVARGISRGEPGRILGFESEPVITLGLRGTAADVDRARWPTVRVDRGGQATLHHPGQLVIFPVWPMAEYGSKAWVKLLADVTARVVADLGQEIAWREDQPGLYDGRGKVVSIGLRIRRGVSTHGLAINVRNRLADFDQIRTCGRAGQALAHVRTDLALADLFGRWTTTFARTINVT